MSNEELIEYITKIWIENGGDGKGLLYLVCRIYEKIIELTS